MKNSESIVKGGLEGYIKKHYRIVLLKGVLVSLALLTASFALLSASEYILWLTPKWRFALFWAFCALSLLLFLRYLLLPIVQYLGFRRKMNSTQAAELIGAHFPTVKDSLLNLLQLEEKAIEVAEPQKSLILASVEQRYNALQNIQFSDAIKFKERNKYLMYALPAVAFLLTLWLYNPNIINDGTQRLINYSEHFQKPLSFLLAFEQNQYEVNEGENLSIIVKASGTKIPARIFLMDNGKKILLTKTDSSTYTTNLSNNFDSRKINIEAGPFTSKNIDIKVLKQPKLLSLVAEIKYPAYTNFNSDENKNRLNITVPEGSDVKWLIKNDALTTTSIHVEGAQKYSVNARKTLTYTVISTNTESSISDTNTYNINVVKDQFPTIAATVVEDSLYKNTFYFRGEISDDYGFSKLLVIAEDITGKQLFTKSIATNSLKKQSFVYILEDAKDVARIYGKVYDNDAVNGAKFSVSQKQNLDILDEEALSNALKSDRNEQLKDLQKLQSKSEKINQDVEKLKNQLKGKKEVSFEEKQKVNELTKDVKKLQEEIEKSKKQNELLNSEEERLSNFDEKILEKQQKLEELFEQLIDPELEKLLNEIQEMMDKENKGDMEKALDDLKINNEDIEKSLDQNMEWLKQLALDKETEDLIKKLDELGKEQEKLAEKDDANSDEQKEIDKKFEEIKKSIEELDKKGEELKKPTDFQESTASEQEEIKKEQEEAKENISQNKQEKANKNQKKAGQKMQEMAAEMTEQKKSKESEQQSEDIESLRAILENLIQLSFDEEQLMEDVKQSSINDPKINTLSQNQKDIKDNFVIVEDSLQALAKRVIQLSGIINKEISSIQSNLSYAQNNLQELRLTQSSVYQQKTMMGFNNLALLLDEVLKQLQMQMAQSKPGQGNCEKPGGSGAKPSLEQLRKMQEQMGKDMEGGKKPGKKGEDGEGGMGKGEGAKQLAQQAAQQAAIRKKIQQMADELKGGKPGSSKTLNDIADEMEKIEEDLVNKRPTPEILKRQRDVLTRLLEAEKADLERELDKERESKSAKNQRNLSKEQRDKYLEQKRQELEILKSYPAGLKPYYKEKTDQYFEQ